MSPRDASSACCATTFNTLWPKASAPTRGSWACSPTMALCRGAFLRAWHMIATWTVHARFFFQNPRRKRLTRRPGEALQPTSCQRPSIHLEATLCNTSTRRAPVPYMRAAAVFARRFLDSLPLSWRTQRAPEASNGTRSHLSRHPSSILQYARLSRIEFSFHLV
jgi:hypothetical protein